MRSLHRAGVTLAFSSDWNVAEMDPMVGLCTAVTRRPQNGGEAWIPEATVDMETAVHVYTMESAYANFPDERGSLTVGTLADLVVLSRDVLVALRDRFRQPAGCKRGPLTGPNPTDRGKLGSKIHLITDRNGLPLCLGISGANMHDSQGLESLVRGIPPIRSRRGPRRRRPAKLHSDKGYDYDHLRRWLRDRGIRHRIARRCAESSQRLGRHRWVVERTISWLAGCRRLHRRYERKTDHFLAFVGIAAVLISYRRLDR
jgi:transposase